MPKNKNQRLISDQVSLAFETIMAVLLKARSSFFDIHLRILDIADKKNTCLHSIQNIVEITADRLSLNTA